MQEYRPKTDEDYEAAENEDALTALRNEGLEEIQTKHPLALVLYIVI